MTHLITQGFCTRWNAREDIAQYSLLAYVILFLNNGFTAYCSQDRVWTDDPL